MKHKPIIKLVTISLLLMLSQQAILVSETSPSPTSSPTICQPLSKEPPEGCIKDKARRITVKVGGNQQGTGVIKSGSGVIIAKKESKNISEKDHLYLVLTNAHVIGDKNPINGQFQTVDGMEIVTSDGRIHQGFYLTEGNKKFGKLDLALVWFSSSINYQKAALGDSNKISSRYEEMYVSGFPCEQKQGNCTFYSLTGVGFLWESPLQEGYQVGYNIDAISGISGGSVLNEKAQLIAIHGKGQFPSLLPKYEFENNQKERKISSKENTLMAYFSWGIPINRYRQIYPKHPFGEVEKSYNNKYPKPPSPNNGNVENNSEHIILSLLNKIYPHVFIGFIVMLILLLMLRISNKQSKIIKMITKDKINK
ncbi:MAG: serine protease [Crocosphaera sp.]|nr:serine protease [Crocosphaera sp.]